MRTGDVGRTTTGGRQGHERRQRARRRRASRLGVFGIEQLGPGDVLLAQERNHLFANS